VDPFGFWGDEVSAMRSKWLLAVIGMGLCVSSSGVHAHHAFAAEFDATKPVTLKGTVTQVDWVNPHIWIHLDVKEEPSGKVVSWMVEWGAPNAMFRRGWNKESIVPGTQVTVDGYRAKNGDNKANGKDVLLPDGRKLFVGSSGTGAPYDTKAPAK